MLDLYPKSCEGRHISLSHYIEGTEGWQIHGKLKEISENCIVIDRETLESERLADVLEENGCDENAVIIRRLPKAKISVDRRRVTSYDSALGEAALGVIGSFCIDVPR